jgi:hypothetical protein
MDTPAEEGNEFTKSVDQGITNIKTEFITLVASVEKRVKVQWKYRQ